jgi:hypothetical protein
MPDISETIYLQSAVFMIKQGQYDLTADALRIRGQRPLYCGDNYSFTFVLVDANGTPVVITGAAITMTAKKFVTDLTGTIFTKSATVTDGAHGTFTVAIANTDVAGPAAIYGCYDIQMTLSAVKTTLLSGNIEFLQNVTP